MGELRWPWRPTGWRDKDVVLAAVAQNGWALKYAHEELRRDKDVVLAAMAQNGEALWYAHEGLQLQISIDLRRFAMSPQEYAKRAICSYIVQVSAPEVGPGEPSRVQCGNLSGKPLATSATLDARLEDVIQQQPQPQPQQR